MEAQAGPSALELGDPPGDLLDGVHLLVQEVGLKKVAKMSVAVSSLVEVEKALIDLVRIVQLQNKILVEI